MSIGSMLSTSPLSATLLPAISQGSKVSGMKTAAAAATTTVSSGSSSTDTIGATFLSLLVQELQNQDPTAPMDSTAMVGQMISLNQLNQLTNIDSTLQTAYGSSAKASTAYGAAGGTGEATRTALHLLQSGTGNQAVSSSVTLPAF